MGNSPTGIEHECKPNAPLPWAPSEAFERKRSPGQKEIWMWEQIWGREISAIPRGYDLESAGYESGNVPSWVAGDSYEAILELLLPNGADLDLGDRQSRTLVLWGGSEATLALLFAKAAHPNLSDMQNRTTLYWAAQRGQEAMVMLLLAVRVNVNLADSTGRTPLSWAAEGEHEAIVEILLNRGADPGPSDSRGQTALPWAACRWRVCHNSSTPI